jgi:hypothetical protein
MLVRDDTKRLANLIEIAAVPADRVAEATEWISVAIETLRSGGRAKFAAQCGTAADWNKQLAAVDKAAAKLAELLESLPAAVHLLLGLKLGHDIAAPTRIRRAVARVRRPSGGPPANLTHHQAADLALEFFWQFLIKPTSDPSDPFPEFLIKPTSDPSNPFPQFIEEL